MIAALNEHLVDIKYQIFTVKLQLFNHKRAVKAYGDQGNYIV